MLALNTFTGKMFTLLLDRLDHQLVK